ncbi:MAG: ankyrin repeat domain-containing protein, partial [Steroidobacteraceae bacterium]
MLLQAGANPDSPNQDGQTALMLASTIGSLPIAQMLIKRGAHVDAVETFRGQTALMWAAAEDHPDIVELLLKHGAAAGINRRGKYADWPREMTSEPRAQYRQTGGLTALLYATRSGCTRCAVDIVKGGADVNEPNPDGITPLINAIDNRAYDIAMFLLEKGANPSAWDMSGRTPLSVAVYMHSYRRSGFAKPFFTGTGWVALSGRPPSKATAMDVVNRLLKMGVDVNHQLTRMRHNGRGRFADYMMRGGTTPLMIATLSYDDEAIKALLAHGAAVNVPNVFRITPLMAAAGMSGSTRGGVGSVIAPPGGGPRKPEDVQARVIRTIDLLLKAGASVNTRLTNSRTHTAKLAAYATGRDHEDQTALFAAAEEGWDRVVKVLLDHGADPQVRDDTNKTALDYARHPPRVFRGPAAARRPSRSEAVSRARTVALLTAALLQKRTGAGETASAR